MRNAAITFLGVFVFAFIVIGLCLVPVFVIFPLVFLIVPVSIVVCLGGALSIASHSSYKSRADGGRIPIAAYVGYGILLLGLIGFFAISVSRQQAEDQKLVAAKQQYGDLFYPGARPDPRYPSAIQTSASLTDVLRFYKESPACDSRKYYGGGGEYTLSCKPTNSASTVQIKLSSRVENNGPYVMISMEP